MMISISHFIEIIATLAGLLNLYFAARANMWNWFFGIVAVSLYFYLFIHSKLYADAGLQLIYLVFQFYGFYEWRKQGPQALSIASMPMAAYIQGCIAFIIIDAIVIYVLTNFTDSTTVWLDATNTALCLVAQWMMVRKWVENWWFWSLANMIALVMYYNKGLYFIFVLHVVFLGFNLYGYLVWKKMLRQDQRDELLAAN